MELTNLQEIKIENTKRIKDFIDRSDVDVFGITSLDVFKSSTRQVPVLTNQLIENYTHAIVLGVRYGKLDNQADGTDTSMLLEKIAMNLLFYIKDVEKYTALIVHTEDEIEPHNRLGMLSLKALAHSAGLGWQGRSLLVVSKEYGPLYRLIAVLTNMPLVVNEPDKNRCGGCHICVDTCPTNSLKWIKFDNHPEKREDVLDISTCIGDEGCVVCIVECPWYKKTQKKIL